VFRRQSAPLPLVPSPLILPRKLILIITIVTVGSVGTVAGLVYAPGSPGLPYLSPTYQAQKAVWQYQSSGDNAAIYEVWYVPSTPTLIIVLAATHPQTHFYSVWTYGGSSPGGNLSIPVYVNNEKTYLVIPASSCPALDQIGPSGYGMNVGLLADSPPGSLSFTYTCQAQLSLATITLGNPHVIVPSLIQPPHPNPNPVPKESLNVESFSFNTNNMNLTLSVRNTGSVAIAFASYYVKDSNGNQYARLSWPTDNAGKYPAAVNPNGLVSVNIAISTACGSSCTGATYQFSSGYSYTVTLVTTRNNQFSWTGQR